MISASANDIIKTALRMLTVIDIAQEPPAEYGAVGYDTLLGLVDDLALHGRAVRTVARNQHSLTVNVGSYTVGVGGTWNQAYPVEIDAWSVIPDPAASPVQELPRGDPRTIQEWQGIPAKLLTSSLPTDLYYDHGWVAGLATVQVYPAPNTSTPDIVLYTPTPFATFADQSTVYTFPPGHWRMLTAKLACELGVYFPPGASEKVEAMAREALANIKRRNVRPQEARFDPMLGGTHQSGGYNPYTDR